MTVAEASSRLRRVTEQLSLVEALAPRGVVERVGDGVAFVAGLERVGYEEIVEFDGGARGFAFDLREHTTGVVLLDGGTQVAAGEGVRGTGRLPEVAVGSATLGRVIDPLGRPLDDLEPLRDGVLPLFRPAPELIARKTVDEPLWTGVAVLDAAVPIGRGQRELVLGDRNVGKTALALDVISAQRHGDVVCVYVVIAQPMSRVLGLREALRQRGCLANTVVVAADAAASPGMRYLAPHAGASVAEWFRDRGGHALVVYDDLTKHADAYRELALLLDRPPGREAYPGDVFYLHAELLERAAARRPEAGGGSVTALPIVETTEGDLASYIPTNVISITDGQIHLDTGRFERNERPAVDVGRSVSRIGGAAQPPVMRRVASDLRVSLARFEQLEALVRVGLEIDAEVERELTRGRLLRALLRQGQAVPRGIAEQVVGLVAVGEGWLDRVPADAVTRVVGRLLERARVRQAEIVAALDAGQVPPDGWEKLLGAIAAEDAAPEGP